MFFYFSIKHNIFHRFFIWNQFKVGCFCSFHRVFPKYFIICQTEEARSITSWKFPELKRRLIKEPLKPFGDFFWNCLLQGFHFLDPPFKFLTLLPQQILSIRESVIIFLNYLLIFTSHPYLYLSLPSTLSTHPYFIISPVLLFC